MKDFEVMQIAVFRFRPALVRFHSLNGVDGLDFLGQSLLVQLFGMVFGAQVCVERCISTIACLWAEEKQSFLVIISLNK